MKKKLLLLVIPIILFALLVNAYTSDHFGLGEEALFYSNFSGNATDQVYNVTGSVGSGVTLINDRNGTPNSAYNFSGDNNAMIEYANGLGGNYSYMTKLSVGAWVYRNETASGRADYVISLFDAGANQRYVQLWIRTDEKAAIYIGAPGTYVCSGTADSDNFPAGWTHIVGTYDQAANKNCTLYINGVQKDSDVGDPDSISTGAGLDLKIGQGENAGEQMKGMIDEPFIINRTLNGSEVENLFLYGDISGAAPPTPDPPGNTINISFTRPADQFNTTQNTFRINATYNSSTNNYNISWYINGTFNFSDDFSQTGNDLIQWLEPTFADGHYTYQIQMQDLNNLSYGDNSSTVSFFVNSLQVNDSFLPETNEQFSEENITFQTNLNSTNAGDCFLYFNNSHGYNQTTSFTAGTNKNISFDVEFASTFEESISYYFLCNTSLSSFNGSDYSNEIFVDLVFPMITSNFSNFTIAFAGDNITGSFNFTDDLLIYSYNISIDGLFIDGDTNITTNFFQYNLTYNTTNLSIGEHILTTRIADGHTAHKLKYDYEVHNGLLNNYLEFNYYEGGYTRITPTDWTLFDKFTAKKGYDRYTFTYEADNPKSKQEFIVDSSYPLSIVQSPNGEFGGQWIVSGNHWTDFDLLNNPGYEVEIELIDDYTAVVVVKGIKDKKVMEFRSHGDLNVLEYNYTFYITNTTFVASSSVAETSVQSIQTSSNNTGFNNITAALFWNGTRQSVNEINQSLFVVSTSIFSLPSIQSDVNVSYYWEINYTGQANSFSKNFSFSQTIINIGINNCTGFGTGDNESIIALNMTIKNEDNGSVEVEGSIAGYFEVYLTNPDNFIPFNLTWTKEGSTSHALCISPNSTTINITAQMIYNDDKASGAGTFNDETYYFVNYTLDNNTDYLNLYLTEGLARTFTIVDQDNTPLEDVYVWVLRYFFETNSYVVSEIMLTDQDGIVTGTVSSFPAWYKFIFIRNNAVIGEEEARQFPSTELTRTFLLNLQEDFFESFDEQLGLVTSLIYNPTTNNFSLSFTNPTGQPSEVCLKVYEERPVSSSLFVENCQFTSGATLLASAGNSSFHYTGYATATVDNITTFLGSITTAINSTFLDDIRLNSAEQEIIMGAWLVKLAMACAAIWNPLVAILLLLATDGLLIGAGIMPMSKSMLVIYAVFLIASIIQLARNR